MLAYAHPFFFIEKCRVLRLSLDHSHSPSLLRNPTECFCVIFVRGADFPARARVKQNMTHPVQSLRRKIHKNETKEKACERMKLELGRTLLDTVFLAHSSSCTGPGAIFHLRSSPVPTLNQQRGVAARGRARREPSAGPEKGERPPPPRVSPARRCGSLRGHAHSRTGSNQ